MRKRGSSDFQEAVDGVDDLCSIADLRFDNGNLPNYEDPLIQQLYLLRYFPAYFVEYYLIYREVIQQEFIQEPLNVLSIGSGCALDYYALSYALEEVERNSSEYVYYTGVDRIEWDYVDSMGNDDFEMITDDIDTWDNLQGEEYNILFFPKSIGEFSSDTFNNLLRAIEHTNFRKHKIYVISSIRASHISSDIERVENVIETLCEFHDFSALDAGDCYTHFEEKVGIKKYIHGFVYPDEIKDYITDLYNKCNSMFLCDQDCETGQLNKWPVLTTKYINYQIIRLQKNN